MSVEVIPTLRAGGVSQLLAVQVEALDGAREAEVESGAAAPERRSGGTAVGRR